MRGADELGVLELPVLPTHSVEEVGEVLAAQMAEQIGIEDQMFKLHFVDGEGDSVLVSTHTEIDDLLLREHHSTPGACGRAVASSVSAESVAHNPAKTSPASRRPGCAVAMSG